MSSTIEIEEWDTSIDDLRIAKMRYKYQFEWLFVVEELNKRMISKSRSREKINLDLFLKWSIFLFHHNQSTYEKILVSNDNQYSIDRLNVREMSDKVERDVKMIRDKISDGNVKDEYSNNDDLWKEERYTIREYCWSVEQYEDIHLSSD